MQHEFDGFEHPNHTQVPNDFFDRLLPMIKHESELRVTLVAIRRTLGYHTENAELSLSFLMAATGMSRRAVREGLAHAIKRGTIMIVNKQTARNGAIYGVRWNKNQGDTKDTPRGSQKIPLEVSPGYPINKGKKDKEISAGDALAPAPVIEYTQSLASKTIRSKSSSADDEFDALPSASAAKARVEVPPAVKVFREVRRSYPPRETYALIHETVGEQPDALELWRQVLIGYSAMGWNPRNILGALDFFKRGEVPSASCNGKQKPGGNGNGHGEPIGKADSIRRSFEIYEEMKRGKRANSDGMFRAAGDSQAGGAHDGCADARIIDCGVG